MNRHQLRCTFGRLALFGWLLGMATLSGCHCVTMAAHAVPASRLDPMLFGECKSAKVPVLYTALGQQKPKAHRISGGDTLSIYVFGVLPPSTDSTPVLEQFTTLNQRYYPPNGGVVRPTTGLPLTVDADGTLDLPLIGRVELEGLTLQEARAKIKAVYTEKKLLQEGRERVSVDLITARVHRIVVLRQDTPFEGVALVNPGQVDHIHRGSAQVIDLPAYENDVLHALASTGGLPGTDAAAEVWVMRNTAYEDTRLLTPERLEEIASGKCPDSDAQVIRIPLFSYENDELSFGQQDVLLEDGDVVFVPRRNEYFYTGGLLDGAKIPMPIDDDLDVLEAIALATGSTGGPLGQSGMALASGRPGHMIKPSRVLILRKLPDGEQLAIRVDLARAMEDKKERIIIQPDDLIMLNFKPGEAIANGLLNFVNFSTIGALN